MGFHSRIFLDPGRDRAKPARQSSSSQGTIPGGAEPRAYGQGHGQGWLAGPHSCTRGASLCCSLPFHICPVTHRVTHGQRDVLITQRARL